MELRPRGLLTQLGHDVTSIVRDHALETDDHDVLAIARAGQRILITNDLDFGEVVVRYRAPPAGVILFRMHDAPAVAKHAQ
jgi:predicted nuclease of predicted toxin-antitoxin system